MWKLDETDYSKFLGVAAKVLRERHKLPDLFARYALPIDASDEAEISSALDAIYSFWNKRKSHSRDGPLVKQLLSEHPEARRVLLDSSERDARRAKIENERTARLALLDERIARRTRKGYITPEETAGLVEQFSKEGFSESEIRARIRVPEKAETRVELPTDENLIPKGPRAAIRDHLAFFGKTDLYAFLEIPRETSKAGIEKRTVEHEAEWNARPATHPQKTDAQRLHALIRTHLIIGDPATYLATLEYELWERLKPEVDLAAADGRVTPKELREILADAANLGIDERKAEDWVLAHLRSLGAIVEVAPEARPPEPPPQPAPEVAWTVAGAIKLLKEAWESKIVRSAHAWVIERLKQAWASETIWGAPARGIGRIRQAWANAAALWSRDEITAKLGSALKLGVGGGVLVGVVGLVWSLAERPRQEAPSATTVSADARSVEENSGMRAFRWVMERVRQVRSPDAVKPSALPPADEPAQPAVAPPMPADAPHVVEDAAKPSDAQAAGTLRGAALVELAVEGDADRIRSMISELKQSPPEPVRRMWARDARRYGEGQIARALYDEAQPDMNNGQFDKAVELLRRAYEADPTDAEIADFLGFALRKAGKLAESEAHLLAVLEQWPDRRFAWQNLAVTASLIGKSKQAVALFETSYRLSENPESSMNELMRVAESHSDPLVRTDAAAAIEGIHHLANSTDPELPSSPPPHSSHDTTPELDVEHIEKPAALGGAVDFYATRQAIVRDGPTTAGTQDLGVLERGSRIQGTLVTGATTDAFWLKIASGRFAGAFVSNTSLSPEPRPPVRNVVNADLTISYPTELLGAPGDQNALIETLEPPLTVHVYAEVEGGWMEIQRRAGGVGYVAAAAIAPNPIENSRDASVSDEASASQQRAIRNPPSSETAAVLARVTGARESAAAIEALANVYTLTGTLQQHGGATFLEGDDGKTYHLKHVDDDSHIRERLLSICPMDSTCQVQGKMQGDTLTRFLGAAPPAVRRTIAGMVQEDFEGSDSLVLRDSDGQTYELRETFFEHGVRDRLLSYCPLNSNCQVEGDMEGDTVMRIRGITPLARGTWSEERAAPGTGGPSFDCTKASSKQERMICNDRHLAEMDTEMDRLYSELKAKTSDSDKEALKENQQRWLQYRKSCADVRCLTDAYDEKIVELSEALGDH